MKPPTHNMLYLKESDLRTDLERQLWVVVQWQAEQIRMQGERIAALEKENAELRILLAKALKNSSTSSKPPSSDIVKPPKPPASTPGGKRKRGGQPGHVKHSRLPFDAASVTATTTYTLKACPHCRGKLKLLKSGAQIVQQVEVVATPIEVEEHRGLAYWCAHCQKIHYAPLPPAVEKGGLIGPVLTAQIAYMKSALHASFSSIRKYVRDVMGLTVSRGQLSKIVQKVSAALEEPYGELMALLRNEDILNVDETGHKNNADRFWTWCFRAPSYTVFKVSPSRGSDVLLDVLGSEFEGVLGCDFFSAYRKYMRLCDIRVQFCLAHFIRDLKFLATLPDAATAAYGERLLKEMRVLFFLIHRHEEFPPHVFARALHAMRGHILSEAQRDVPESRDAQRIAKRLREHGAAYFEFITTPGMEPTNNLAEQAIRFVAIDRHITQGTRSDKGCEWSERIWTVMATCALQGRSAFDYLVEVVQAYFNGRPVPSLLLNPP
jgi:transposase